MQILVLSALAENGCGKYTGGMDWTGKAGCGGFEIMMHPDSGLRD